MQHQLEANGTDDDNAFASLHIRDLFSIQFSFFFLVLPFAFIDDISYGETVY